MDPLDPYTPLLAQTEMAAGRRSDDHCIDKTGFLDERFVGPLYCLLVASRLQVRESETKLRQVPKRIERTKTLSTARPL